MQSFLERSQLKKMKIVPSKNIIKSSVVFILGFGSLKASKLDFEFCLCHKPLKTRNEISYDRVLKVESDTGSIMVQAVSLGPSIQFFSVFLINFYTQKTGKIAK